MDKPLIEVFTAILEVAVSIGFFCIVAALTMMAVVLVLAPVVRFVTRKIGL